ncbi:unnamed protein product [Cunninghamella blakesleeana]
MSSTAYDEIAATVLPAIELYMKENPDKWPEVKGLFIFTVTKKKKPASIWYLLLQGKGVQPVITNVEQVARDATQGKVKIVRIEIEDSNVVGLVTGGVTGVKAFMSGKIKVKGDLLLAQRLEAIIEQLGAREVSVMIIYLDCVLFKV